MEFFRKVKATCAAEFMSYVNCMEKSSGDMQFYECRKTQGVYDKCVEEKMGLKRPHYGYHCLPKVNLDISKVHILYIPSQIHDTDRPAPKEEKPAWMENEKVYQPNENYICHTCVLSATVWSINSELHKTTVPCRRRSLVSCQPLSHETTSTGAALASTTRTWERSKVPGSALS